MSLFNRKEKRGFTSVVFTEFYRALAVHYFLLKGNEVKKYVQNVHLGFLQ